MSGIPPTGHSSIIQTTGAAQRSSGHKATEAAAQAERSGGFADRLQDVIESNDRDSQVYSDAEGQGGQGRPSDDGDAQEQESKPDAATDGDTSSGLDIEA